MDSILNAGPKPQIELLIPLLEKLKGLKVKSQMIEILQSMANDHSFVADLWFRIQDLEKRMLDDNAMVTDEAFDYKTLKRAV